MCMPNYSIKILDSVDELVSDAEAWNSLWERTGCLSPLVRAECIAQWIRRFAPDAVFRAVVIESDGTFVASIPLILRRRAKILRTAVLPGNEWGRCGSLLCDASRQDTEAIFSHLVKGLKQLPIDFLWCEGIRFEGFPWKNFCEYWSASGHSLRTKFYWHTAVIPLHGNPETVTAAWNKSEIANIKRRFRKGYTENHEFCIVSNPDEIAALLPDCFAIENAGWKGQEGSGGSIIKKDMVEYFSTQAKMLAEQGLIRLYTLFVTGRLTAFQYGYLANKTVYSMKIGYDPAMREFSPGIVLRWLLCQSLLNEPKVEYLDCTGIAGAHQKVWNSELHTVGQVLFPLSLRGSVALAFYKLYSKIKFRTSKNTAPTTDAS